MSFVSDSSLREDEFDRWKKECDQYDIIVPSAEELRERKRHADKLRENYEYTPV